VKTCIRRKYIGGVDDQSFDSFVESTIQDARVAEEVASTMLVDYPRPYEWNRDEPEYYETFEILDAEELERCVVELRRELSWLEPADFKKEG
jgi:hypothetical protein